MSDRHLAHWPSQVPRHLWIPETHLYRNAEVSAMRYPRKALAIFYDSELSYARFADETTRLAGWLRRAAGVQRGDRVLLLMQNSPQFMIAFYAILRADAVVVPINPMNLAGEHEHLAADTGAVLLEKSIVTASRRPQPAEWVSDDYRVVNVNDRAAAGLTNLGEILGRATAAIVNDYGGGSPRSIDLRGAGSSRTLVLVDGLPAGLAGNDLGDIALQMVDRVEIHRQP